MIRGGGGNRGIGKLVCRVESGRRSRRFRERAGEGSCKRPAEGTSVLKIFSNPLEKTSNRF